MAGIVSAFARWRLAAAARSYAGKLGPQLTKDYGTSETYTAAQISASVVRAGLPSTYLVVCYAAFMSQDDFLALHTSSTQAVYAEYRALYQRFVPSVSYEDFEPADENAYAQSGATFNFD